MFQKQLNLSTPSPEPLIAQGHWQTSGKPRHTTAQLFDSSQLASLHQTLILRAPHPCPALGLESGDLLIISKNQASLQGYQLIRTPDGHLQMAEGGELPKGHTLIGKLDSILPGAKGLRYLRNVRPLRARAQGV